MQGNIASLAARYAGRPVLMEPRALAGYAARIHDMAPRATEREGTFKALLRSLRGPAKDQNLAMDEGGMTVMVPLDQRLAYAPRYIGEPDDTGYCWALKNGIAMMCVNTPIMDEGEEYCGTVYHGYDTLLAGMSEAWADGRVKAIWIKMKTPGGVAAPGIMALAAWMRAHRAGEPGGKPIWIYADQMCSAGMWVGAQGNVIHAPPMGYVGSVGAYTLHEDDSAYLEKIGVVITEITSDPKKTDGAPWKALSVSAKADIQAEIDQLKRNFLDDMVAGRPKMSREALMATQAAAFFAQADDPARSGLALGFVDEIMTEEESFASLLKEVSSPAISNLPVSAPAGGARADSHKEQPMANKAEQKAAKLAALNAEDEVLRKNASAHTDRLAAIASEKKSLEGDDEEDEDDEDGTNPDGSKKKPDDGEDEASKISTSTEAQKHPGLALAAVASKQTFAQFQATVKAADAAPKKGALAAAMENSPRLAPDGGVAKAADDLNPASIYAGRAQKRS